MDRHFEIWGGIEDSDEFLETIIGPAHSAIAEAMDAVRHYQSEGYCAYARDMDNGGSMVVFDEY